MNSVLLWGGGGAKTKISECICKEKRENKEPGETKAIQQTSVAFGGMQQQQKCISDGKQQQDRCFLLHNRRRCTTMCQQAKKHKNHMSTRGETNLHIFNC